MANRLPIVCIFGATGIRLFSSPECPSFETKDLDCRCYRSDDNLDRILVEDDPDVVVTIGRAESYQNLMASSADVSRRWIHFQSADDLAKMGRDAFYCYIDNCVRERTDLPPLVSVFTPAFRTGDKIHRPYASLCAQSYRNWEWIIVDDSDDDGETFRTLSALARKDHRVGVFRHHRHTGSIGQVKRWACRLANGRILAELDHDDELTPWILQEVVRAFRHFDGSGPERPAAGFVYSDFAEVLHDGKPCTYADDWGFGYGSYRWETYAGRSVAVANAPNINPKTIRHIVAAPNHIRCWARDCYEEIGGHGRHIYVADDYEILVRTFLGTRMVRVPQLGYVQWRNRGGSIQGGNTHQERNAEIQRLTRAFSQRYDRAIHERFLALGVDDFVWKEGESSFLRMGNVVNPTPEPHCTLTLPPSAQGRAAGAP